MREPRNGVIAAAVLVASAVPLIVTTPASSAQPQEAFGFEVGEERRYTMGPPESLDAGESALWMMRLERIRDNGEAVFALDHQRKRPDSTTGTPAYGEEIEATMVAELRVNEHGFPMHLEVDVFRSFYGYPEVKYFVRYEFDGRRMNKSVSAFGRQWDIELGLSSHDRLDRSVPIGLYAFLPDAFHCVGYRTSVAYIGRPTPTTLSPGSGTAPSTPPPVVRHARECEPDTDLGFLNPGLLSIAWPAVIEQEALREEFVFFTPTGADLFTGPQVNVTLGTGGSGGGTSVGNRGVNSGGNVDRARDRSRYYAHSQIELGEPTEIRIRGRRMDAVKASIRGLVGDAYFDENGKVLLIDITGSRLVDADIRTSNRGSVSVATPFDLNELEPRHIRLMFPSEY